MPGRRNYSKSVQGSQLKYFLKPIKRRKPKPKTKPIKKPAPVPQPVVRKPTPQVLPPIGASSSNPLRNWQPYRPLAPPVAPAAVPQTTPLQPLSLSKVPSNAEVIKDHAQALEQKDADFFFRVYPGPYTVDVKRDGERNWTYKKGKNVALINKYSTVYLPPGSPLRKDFVNTQNVLPLSKILEQDILNALGNHDGIFDTEYMTQDDNHDTLAKERWLPDSVQTKVSLFDAMEVDGKDVRQEPLAVRRKLLNEIVKPNGRVEINETNEAKTRQEAEDLAKKYIKEHHEGGVIKPLGHRYDASKWQLKEKGTTDGDFVVLGIERTKDYTNNATPHSFVIGVRTPNGKYRIVGQVGTGLKDEERRQIGLDLKPEAINAAAAAKDYEGGIISNVEWFKPKVVLDIKYGKVNPTLHLREPRILRRRYDKAPDQCSISQIT